MSIIINQLNRLYKIEEVLGRQFCEMLDRVELEDPFFYESYTVSFKGLQPLPPVDVLRLDPHTQEKINTRIQDNYNWFFFIMYLLDNVDLEESDIKIVKYLVRVQCSLATRLRRLQSII